MTASSSSVDRLRQAIAETLSTDAQGLQAAIGQLVVATSTDYPAAGPHDRSLYSSAVRTTVLLADRIPAGQEAQALAQEIALHHGREAAQAVLGERAAELLVNTAATSQSPVHPTGLAYQPTEEDVVNVLSSNKVTAEFAHVKSLEQIAADAFPGLDFYLIEQAALFGDDLHEQTDYANDEIARQLREIGVLEPHRSAQAELQTQQSVVRASNFHSMRGHVAQGTRVLFESGEVLVVQSAIKGWKLVSPDGSLSLGPFDGALELTSAVVRRDANTAGRVPLVAGDKVFVKSEQKLATVLDVYGDGLQGAYGDVRLDLCGNTHLDDIERYDAAKHAAFDHTFTPIRREWKEAYGITQEIPLRAEPKTAPAQEENSPSPSM